MAINPRWLRTGRVAYNDDTDFTILVRTPEPSRWYTISSVGVLRLRSTKNIAASYSRLITSLNSLPVTSASLDSLTNALNGLDVSSERSAEAIGLMNRIRRRIDVKPLAGPSIKTISEGMFLSEGAIKDAIEAAAVATPEASRASGKFEVPPYDPDSFWYESDEDSSLYRDFIELRTQHHPVNLLIAGPSGSGKTEGIIRLGRELGVPVHIINCQAITTPEKWIGQMHADIESGTRFIPSQHIEWVERTSEDCEGFDQCILLYDEITRLRPELNNMTYSLFDTQRGLEVPQMGRRVLMAQENMIVATANIGSAFTGTHTQDRAFRERFAITMERSFPPAKDETQVLTSSCGISKDAASTLVTVANSTRTMWGNDEIESPVSTRTLKAWALLVSGGYSIKKAAEYTVIPLYSNDGGLSSDRTKVASLIEGKVR